MLTAIWAHAKNGIIGKDNALPWSLPNDMRFFKQQTLGKSVVMGRRTFESMGCRPLPHRTNYVLTQEEDFKATWEGNSSRKRRSDGNRRSNDLSPFLGRFRPTTHYQYSRRYRGRYAIFTRPPRF